MRRYEYRVACTKCGNYGTVRVSQFLYHQPLTHSCKTQEWTWPGPIEWDGTNFVFCGKTAEREFYQYG